MRFLKSFESLQECELFSDFLISENIENDIREKEIWVLEDTDLKRAEVFYEEFIKNPNSDKFQAAKGSALAFRKKEDADKAWAEKNYRDARKAMQQGDNLIVTWGIIALTVIMAFYLSAFSGENSLFTIIRIPGENALTRFNALVSIFIENPLVMLQTIFIPFLFTGVLKGLGILDILFSGYWFYIFGERIEKGLGPTKLLVLSFILQGVCSLALLIVFGQPSYGVFPVVYGLAGFLYQKTMAGNNRGLFIHQNTIYILMAFMAFGFILGGRHAIPRIVAELVGFLLGFGLALFMGNKRRP